MRRRGQPPERASVRGEVSSPLVETFRVEGGEVVAAGAGWVYAWRVAGAGPRVVYVGATRLHPAARAEKHLRDPDPDVGRIRARLTAAGGDPLAPTTIHAVEVPHGGRRALVQEHVVERLHASGQLSPHWCGRAPSPPAERLTPDEEACVAALVAALALP